MLNVTQDATYPIPNFQGVQFLSHMKSLGPLLSPSTKFSCILYSFITDVTFVIHEEYIVSLNVQICEISILHCAATFILSEMSVINGKK